MRSDRAGWVTHNASAALRKLPWLINTANRISRWGSILMVSASFCFPGDDHKLSRGGWSRRALTCSMTPETTTKPLLHRRQGRSLRRLSTQQHQADRAGSPSGGGVPDPEVLQG